MKKVKYFVLSLLLFFGFCFDVDASSMSIWANATNVKVGNTVVVSVKVSDIGGEFKVTSSDGTVLSGGTNSKWLENDTYTFSFTANKVGKAVVTVTAIDAATTSAEVFTGSKSVTLNVVSASTGGGSNNGASTGGGGTVADKKEYSKNNDLSSLSVEGYDLEPKFDKDTLEYKIKVDQSVEKIKVDAKAADSEASVSGIGEVNLSMGENVIDIKVVAENGNEKIYKLTVLVEDLNPIEVKVGKKKYTIVKKNNDLIKVLQNYEEKIIEINKQEVISYYNSKTKVSLVILKNSNGNLSYFVYDKKNNKYLEYKYISVGGVDLQIISPDKVLDNFSKYSIKIGDDKVNIYKLDKKSKMGLIYGVNTMSGNKGYYVYDEKEVTLSRYYDEEIDVYRSYNKKLENIIMAIVGVVSFGIIIFVIVSIRKSKKKKYRF